jgi:hypothetical protein
MAEGFSKKSFSGRILLPAPSVFYMPPDRHGDRMTDQTTALSLCNCCRSAGAA